MLHHELRVTHRDAHHLAIDAAEAVDSEFDGSLRVRRHGQLIPRAREVLRPPRVQIIDRARERLAWGRNIWIVHRLGGRAGAR